MQCQSCKKQIANDHTECPFCGVAVTSMPGAAGSALTSAPVAAAVPAASSAATAAPGAPAQATVLAPAAVPLPASRMRRFCNYLVDAIVLYIVGFFVGVTINPSNRVGLSVLLGFVTSFVFYTIFETALGRTPGKFVTGTRVVMKDGSKPTFGAVVIRSLSRIVPFEPLSLLSRVNPAGWHDRWAGTYVVPNTYTEADVRAIDITKSKSSRAALIAVICILVLLPVLGILSSVVLASLNTARAKGADARRVADIKQIQLSLELYYDANASYPSSLSELAGDDYSNDLPVDPITQTPYLYTQCGTRAYHIAAVLGTQSPVLQNDADVEGYCNGDTINGKDDYPCTGVASPAGGYCFDTVSNLDDAAQQGESGN